MSEHDYTEAEHRLLCQYDLLKDIKEGRRKLIAPPRQPKQPQQQAKPTTAAPAATAGQKLPSRIRLKAVTKPTPTASEQPDSPLPPPSPQSTHPAGASTGVVAKSSVEAAAPAAAEPVQATVSRAQLAALLKQKQEQPQPQPDSAVEVEAAEQPVLTPAAEQPAVQPVVRSAPGVTGSLHRAPQIAPPSMAEEQQAPARSAAPQEEEIDYGAVSSPEYDVDYDAVSSPEYEVSGRASAAAAAADHAEASNAKQDTQLLTLTPDRKDSRLSPAARYGSRPSPHQASRQPRPNYSAARRRSRSRSPSSSCSPTRRRRSSSRSRSPTRRRRSSSRSRSPTRRRRSSSRSRSPTRRRRSREDGRGLGSRTSRSWRRNSRSRSPRGSRRRSSPDYGIGAGPGASGRQQAQSPSRSGSPTPDLRQRGRNKGRQQSRQKHPTLFVGDLPPAGFASEDLHGLFTAYGWCIISARVQGSQCYGFVEFENRVDAEEALHLIETKDEGFIVNGTSIRASWAKGSMPDWKKGKAVLMPRDKSVGLEGLEAYEHPTARLMRLQAAAVAAMSGLAVPPGSDVGGAASDGQLPVVQTAARQLIDYGDL